MRSLRELLSTHAPLLLIDSSSTRVRVGLLRSDAPPLWESSTDEAGTAVFTLSRRLLEMADVSLKEINAFVFADAPGSVLGVRTTAVAIRTWNVVRTRPVFSFCSLAVIAHALVKAEKIHDFSVVADARRDSWHQVVVDAQGAVSPLRRVHASALTGALFMPDAFRHWATPPMGAQNAPYVLADDLALLEDIPLFQETAEPDAFLHEEPAYQTWTPQVHRAPS